MTGFTYAGDGNDLLDVMLTLSTGEVVGVKLPRAEARALRVGIPYNAPDGVARSIEAISITEERDDPEPAAETNEEFHSKFIVPKIQEIVDLIEKRGGFTFVALSSARCEDPTCHFRDRPDHDDHYDAHLSGCGSEGDIQQLLMDGIVRTMR